MQIKDLILGAALTGTTKDRDEYLKKQAEAQFAVEGSGLVEAVRNLLARHDMQKFLSCITGASAAFRAVSAISSTFIFKPLPMMTSPGFWPAAQGPSYFAAIFMCVSPCAGAPGIGGPPWRVEVTSTV